MATLSVSRRWGVWLAAGLAAIAILPMPGLRHGHSMAEMEMAGSGATARPATRLIPIACEKLADVPGKSLTTALVEYPPDAYTPRHRHPGSVWAYVLKGTLRSQLGGGPVGTFTAGQSWFEPPGTIHLFAENASTTEPAELLATFITDDGCKDLVIRD